MRGWLLTMLMAAMPGLAAQAQQGETPATVATGADGGHAICGGDTVAARTPVILTGYGKGGFPITTTRPGAQAFFDNGMQLAHAFAHKAAIAAFKQAVAIDPDCAMCAWGEAWASGPTINYTVDAKEIAPLVAMTARAATLAARNGTPRERALIAALAQRYRDGGGGKPGDVAFMKAMDALVAQYPTDNEIATIAADAALIAPWPKNDLSLPWHSVALLEKVLARDPDYAPAIHFYIHATEVVDVPKRAEPYADRLTALAPNASHLVHMPSHTWYWLGRYQDAADANMRAVRLGIANAKRLGMPGPDGVWNLPYHAHNVVYGLGGALMSGDAATGLTLGRPLVARAAVQAKAPAFMQMLAASGYFAMARFAPPAETLALPEPKTPFLAGYWHYARGEAAARTGDVAAVRREAAAIPSRVAEAGEDAALATRMLRIARSVLDGRVAMLEDRPRDAARAFRRAAAWQEERDFADIADPPVWWYPVRRSVAEAVLAQGDAAGALREAEASLALRPNDPVALAVKARAQTALGQTAAARGSVRAALAEWHGDARLRAMLPP
jgi:tetratricopeptide (TPR) repeat protein